MYYAQDSLPAKKLFTSPFSDDDIASVTSADSYTVIVHTKTPARTQAWTHEIETERREQNVASAHAHSSPYRPTHLAHHMMGTPLVQHLEDPPSTPHDTWATARTGIMSSPLVAPDVFSPSASASPWRPTAPAPALSSSPYRFTADFVPSTPS